MNPTGIPSAGSTGQDEDYYARRQRKNEEMQAYVLACLFLIGLITLGVIAWRAVT